VHWSKRDKKGCARLESCIAKKYATRKPGKLSKKAMTALHDRVARATAAQRAAEDEPEDEEGEDDEESGDEEGDDDGSGDDDDDGGGGGGGDDDDDAEGPSGPSKRWHKIKGAWCAYAVDGRGHHDDDGIYTLTVPVADFGRHIYPGGGARFSLTGGDPRKVIRLPAEMRLGRGVTFRLCTHPAASNGRMMPVFDFEVSAYV